MKYLIVGILGGVISTIWSILLLLIGAFWGFAISKPSSNSRASGGPYNVNYWTGNNK